MNYIEGYLSQVQSPASSIPAAAIERLLLLLGVGGSASHASHAACDFRKLAGFEAYAATDNVPELTARTNDTGWNSIFSDWLESSRLNPRDAVFILSVGGGDAARNVSANLVAAMDYAKQVGSTVLAIVGRDGGHAARVADAVVIIPTVDAGRVTAHTEGFQSVLLHLLVFHPDLQTSPARWEALP